MKNFALLFFLTVTSIVNSQINLKIEKNSFKTSDKKGLSEAIKNIKYGDYFFDQKISYGYIKAYNYYAKAYEYNKSNAILNYKIGVCIILGQLHYNALVYLEEAYNQNTNLTEDFDFFYARSLHLSNSFEEAINHYEAYEKKNLKNKTSVSKYIEECINGKNLKKNPKIVFIKNMKEINSPFKDYCTMLTADGREMYFTSRRPTMFGNVDPNDNMYFEDIYYSKKDTSGWSLPQYVKSLNTQFHDDVVGLSQDGNTLIIYRDGDLFYCEKNGDKWTQPKAFPKTINSSQIESSACFSPDGRTLYFVRGKNIDKPQESNADIYYSKQDEKGNWSEPVKISSNINSSYDEDGLFMLADGKTLYFSSKGHNSIGGYDIFVTTRQDDGSFSNPVNLGYPINSSYDDIYFVMEPTLIKGYFSSTRNDSQGLMDVYEVLFLEKAIKHNTEDNLIACQTTPTREIAMEDMVLIVVTGKIIDQNTNSPIDAEILIIDNNTNEIVYRTKANSQTGEYTITIPNGKNYGMTIRKDGYMFYSENFDLITNSKKEDIQKNIVLQTIEKEKTITLKNIFFDFASSNLKPSSRAELMNVVDFMKNNPKIQIEISGHTDNIGSADNNQTLSEQRADVVKQYIVEQGIEANRIITKGYGFSKPVADNQTEDGRKQNRRVELRIVEK